MSVHEGVTVIDGTKYNVSHYIHCEKRILEKKVVVPGFGHLPFHIIMKNDSSPELGKHVMVTVLPPEGQNIEYEVKITAENCNAVDKDIVDRRGVTTKPMLRGFICSNCTTYNFVFVRKGLKRNPTYLAADLERFLNKGSVVTLIASDREVTVSKMLLQIRSPVLEAMFDHDMKENQSSKIVLKQFDSKTLQSFCDYLINDRMEQEDANVLDLYLLADKYDVKGLKKEAEIFILNNLKDFDKKQVFDIFSKTNPELIIDLLEEKFGY